MISISTAVLALTLILGLLRADAQVANSSTLPKGWNASPCPVFKTGACTFSRCYQPSVGFLYKFRSYNLKRSTIKQGTAPTNVVNVTGGSAAEIGQSITVKNPGDCCWKCSTTPQCVFWQWIPYLKKPCYLLTNRVSKTCDKATASFGTSSAQRKRQVLVGGKCSATVSNDPHFVGARGTQFDFNGQPDRSFCLHTDTRIHINMLMRGYYDTNTQGATIVKDGKALRTWIKELGILWTAGGVNHKLHLVARNGKQQERGDGFMASMVLDGEALPLLFPGSSHVSAGGLTISFQAVEKAGAFDVDHYTLKLDGLVDLDLKMRLGLPSLQSPTDAEAHFNVGFNDIETTQAVHGVLGQTYREDHKDRSASFSALSAELHAPVVADGESGKGFLDGTPTDYIASSVLTPDCFFSAYETQTSDSQSAVDA